MLPKQSLPREKRPAPLTRATYSIAEYCDMTGQSKAAVLRSMNDGTLPTSNIGNRRFIRTGKSCIQDISKPDNAGPKKLRSREAASAFLGRREQFVPNGIELSELVKLGRQSSFCARATLFAENDPSVTVYMLTHGTARLYKMLHDGRRQIVDFALPGDFLGLPVSDRYRYSVDAVSQVSASLFLRVPFLGFLQANPVFVYWMFEASLRETSAARDHMLLLGRGSAEQRLAEFIISWRARTGRAGVLSNLVPLPMPRNDIADFLGLTNETVSRVLAKLERENVIRFIPKGLQLMGSTERPALFERSCHVR